jgi:small subunit ribosomal protein S1
MNDNNQTPLSIELSKLEDLKPEPTPQSKPARKQARAQEPEKPYEFPELIAELQKLYEEGKQHPTSQEGKLLTGKISKIEDDAVMVDLGEGKQGQVLRKEFGKTAPAMGDEVSVIVELQREQGVWLVSKQKADDLKRYEAVLAACEKDALVEGTVVARVKGGLSVDIGLRAFLPGSHAAEQFIENLDSFVGQRLQFQAIKVDAKRGSIMLSRKAFSAQENDLRKKQIMTELKEGEVRHGTVKSITDFGAFVDIGGIDGLLHVSDLSWGRVKHTRDVLHVGDSIQVKVLRFTPETGKMSLGLKQLTNDPWSGAATTFAPNTRVKGKVVRLAEFGAFIELAPGVDGLLHVSDLSWDRRDSKAADEISVGKGLELMVLSVDEQNHKLRLGLKQLIANPWVDFLERHPVGSTVKGTVHSLTDFGAFITLEEHIDGLLHISECSWTVRFQSPGEFLRKGETIDAVIIKADAAQERLSLSVKQRYPDPWERILQVYGVGRVVPATIKRILKSGLLVEVEPGFEGFISWREVPEPEATKKAAPKPEEPKTEALEIKPEAAETVKLHGRDEAKARQFKEGDVISAEVVHVNPSDRKFRLSAKDITSNEEKQNFVEYVSQNATEQKQATAKLGERFKEVFDKQN